VQQQQLRCICRKCDRAGARVVAVVRKVRDGRPRRAAACRKRRGTSGGMPSRSCEYYATAS
jgi:hypothetical protein